ncbi:MAG: DEAD/DEAH box helicase family protein [Pseudomonadota bacterium]
MPGGAADQHSEQERLQAIERLRRKRPLSNWKRIGKANNGLPWGRWTHQHDAFEFLLKYLDEVTVNGNGNGSETANRSPKSALIRMPTGTGKTGIMGLAAGYIGSPIDEKVLLVVVPSRALRLQVKEALEWRYWSVVDRRPGRWRPVEGFTPSTLKTALEKSHDDWPGDPMPPVLVCTTTTIAMLSGDAKRIHQPKHGDEVDNESAEERAESTTKENRNEWRRLYRRLLDEVGMVLVDEGHREPAPAWARAIRRFRCPRVLFSATPYRNDLRLFDIGREQTRDDENSQSSRSKKRRRAQGRAPDLGPFRFIYPFMNARESGVIRDVKFEHPKDNDGWVKGRSGSPLQLSTRANRFGKALLDFYESDKVAEIGQWCNRQQMNDGVKDDRSLWPAKVIVRCASVEAVREVKRTLERTRKAGEVIAIHTRFTPSEERDGFYGQVPALGSPEAHKAVFWIHQDILIEGLDHPGFWIIAFFEPFGNERSLVQQIGRVLREPTAADEVPSAIVFSDRTHKLEDSWKGYHGYESEEPPIVGPEEIVERFLQSLPEYFYSRGSYRRTLRITEEGAKDQLWKELRLPCRAQVLQLQGDATHPTADAIDEFIEDIADRLEQRDYTTVQALRPHEARSLGMCALVTLQVSESSRVEPSNFFEIRLSPAAICFVGNLLFWQGPIEISDEAREYGYRPIQSDELRTLLGQNATVRQTSTLNTDLNDAAIRRRSMGAMDLGWSGVALGDEGHAMVTVFATNDQVRRQLNLVRGRVGESNQSMRSPVEFAEWVHSIAKEIGADTDAYPPMLDRYASEVPPPDEAEAAHVLIDPRIFGEHYEVAPIGHDGGTLAGDAPFTDLLEASAVTLEPRQEVFTAKLGNAGPEDGPIEVKFQISYRNDRFQVRPKDTNEFRKSFLKLFRKQPQSTTKWKPETLLASKASVQIVTRKGLMYTDGRFYEPRRLWGPERASQLPEIHGIKRLANITHGEKGFVWEDRPGGKKKSVLKMSKYKDRPSWHRSSLFGLVDRDRSAIYRATDLKPMWLVCDDMGAEYADFIALDDSVKSAPRLVMIHCKMGASDAATSTSAGDLHVVASQALKNLGLFTINTGMLEGRAAKWDGCFQGNEDLPLIRRPFTDPPSGAKFVKHLVETLGRTDVRREVWLVMGNSVSAGAIRESAKSEDAPPANVIHLLYLLQSLRASANALGIQLRLLTKP